MNGYPFEIQGLTIGNRGRDGKTNYYKVRINSQDDWVKFLEEIMLQSSVVGHLEVIRRSDISQSDKNEIENFLSLSRFIAANIPKDYKPVFNKTFA